MPYELEQLLLFQLPLVFTFKAFVEPLLELQYGERSHQLVAETSHTLIQGGCPHRVPLLSAQDLSHGGLSQIILVPVRLGLGLCFDFPGTSAIILLP